MLQKHFYQLYGFCLVWLLRQALDMASQHTWDSRCSLGLRSCMSIFPLGSQAYTTISSSSWTLNPTLSGPSATFFEHYAHDPSSSCQLLRVKTWQNRARPEGRSRRGQWVLPATTSRDPCRVQYANVRRCLCLWEYEVGDTISALR